MEIIHAVQSWGESSFLESGMKVPNSSWRHLWQLKYHAAIRITRYCSCQNYFSKPNFTKCSSLYLCPCFVNFFYCHEANPYSKVNSYLLTLMARDLASIMWSRSIPAVMVQQSSAFNISWAGRAPPHMCSVEPHSVFGPHISSYSDYNDVIICSRTENVLLHITDISHQRRRKQSGWSGYGPL